MVSEMMVFVGTEYTGGPQFHVWVEKTGTTEDLAEAIGRHQNLGSNDFILQHVSMPLLPYVTLYSQRIRHYSTVHMFRLCDLKAQDQARKIEAKKEAEERGRYITKDGTDRLRRRTRQALAMMKAQKEKQRLGGGLVPCYAELERVAREYQGDEKKGLEMTRAVASGSGSGLMGRRGEKVLLTTAPLLCQTPGHKTGHKGLIKDRPRGSMGGVGIHAKSARRSATSTASPSSSSACCSRHSSSSVRAWKKTLPLPLPPPGPHHGSDIAHTPESGAVTPPTSAIYHDPASHKTSASITTAPVKMITPKQHHHGTHRHGGRSPLPSLNSNLPTLTLDPSTIDHMPIRTLLQHLRGLVKSLIWPLA
ncbi:hypothetical protein IAT40_000644 [Kwoniella sp. CBS 6097]